MKPKDIKTALKKWMVENDKKAVDVASMSHVSIKTIDRVLDGSTPSPLVCEAIVRLIQPVTRDE